MEIIRTRKFVDVDVPLDGKHYINCTFTRCRFIYNGGEWSIEDAFVMERNRSKFSGAAARSLELFRRFGYIASHIATPFETE